MSRFTGLKKHLPHIRCPCSIFSCHDSCHNTLCTLPLSCKSLVSGVQSSWLGDPGFSSDTMTYYCKVQNKSADVLEGRKIYGKLQPTTKFCPWKLTPRNKMRVQKIRDSFPDMPYEIQEWHPITPYNLMIIKPSRKIVFGRRKPPQDLFRPITTPTTFLLSWTHCFFFMIYCRPSFSYLLHLFYPAVFYSLTPLCRFLPWWLDSAPKVSSGFAQTSFKVALVNASLLWGLQVLVPGKGSFLTHGTAAIWLEVSNTALDLGSAAALS